jgi:hypothetical protein
MKGEALWGRPCIRVRTGILELEPKVSECAAGVDHGAPGSGLCAPPRANRTSNAAHLAWSGDTVGA